MLPKLPGVEYVLPENIAARGDGRDWVEIGESAPDGKSCILLAESLPAVYTIAEMFAKVLSDEELYSCHEGCG